jgi:ABC-type sugar transport system substrate-binding protein
MLFQVRFYCFFLMLFTFFSCKNVNQEKKITIGFSQCVSNDLWRQEMNISMQIQADLFDNVHLEIVDANSNAALQSKQIQQFIDKKVDAIIVSPWQSSPLTAVIQKAINNGIPVLVVDRKTDNQTYTAYLGADNITVGENVGKYIASLGIDNLNIVEIRGLKGSSPAYERSLGFQNEIKKYSNLHLVDSINANWEKQSVKEDFKNY